MVRHSFRKRQPHILFIFSIKRLISGVSSYQIKHLTSLFYSIFVKLIVRQTNTERKREREKERERERERELERERDGDIDED